MNNLKEKIIQLKEKENAIIVAHYYCSDEVQDVADYVGDSYYLSKVARDSQNETIVFCGVEFMAESAKVLSPDKMILMPDKTAGCPMAEMAIPKDVQKVREKYDDLAVVCYINSTLEVKAVSDVIVTSSNAVEIVKKLKEKNIFFIPDKNLGSFIAGHCPDKNFILHDGYCHVHTSIEKDKLLQAKDAHKDALVLSHPECSEEILELSDYIGSTSGIIEFATKSNAKEFIICTELGILFELKNKNEGENKKFYSVGHRQFCQNMKKLSLEKIYDCLVNKNNQIKVDHDLSEMSKKALQRMHELA